MYSMCLRIYVVLYTTKCCSKGGDSSYPYSVMGTAVRTAVAPHYNNLGIMYVETNFHSQTCNFFPAGSGMD